MADRGHFRAEHSEDPPRASAAPPPPPAAGMGWSMTIPEVGQVCLRTAQRLLEISENADVVIMKDGQKRVPVAALMLSGAAGAFAAIGSAIAENGDDFGQAVADALGRIRETMPLTYVVMNP